MFKYFFKILTFNIVESFGGTLKPLLFLRVRDIQDVDPTALALFESNESSNTLYH